MSDRYDDDIQFYRDHLTNDPEWRDGMIEAVEVERAAERGEQPRFVDAEALPRRYRRWLARKLRKQAQ